jgi:DNA-binding transcriptional ArsR family regulator
MEINKTALTFLGLSHPIRLQVFHHIVHSGVDGLRPQELLEKIEIPHATLSFHLKQLLISDLVWVERKGTRLFYHCKSSTVNNIYFELLKLSENIASPNKAIITKPRIKVKPHLSVEIFEEPPSQE